MGRPVSIYALVDPRTDEVRYVGATLDLNKRRRSHVQPSATTGVETRAWLAELAASGLEPTATALETADVAAAGAAEDRQIEAHLARGCRLTNAPSTTRWASYYVREHKEIAAAKLTFTCDSSLLQQLKDEADRTGQPMSSLVRFAITEWLEERESRRARGGQR